MNEPLPRNYLLRIAKHRIKVLQFYASRSEDSSEQDAKIDAMKAIVAEMAAACDKGDFDSALASFARAFQDHCNPYDLDLIPLKSNGSAYKLELADYWSQVEALKRLVTNLTQQSGEVWIGFVRLDQTDSETEFVSILTWTARLSDVNQIKAGNGDQTEFAFANGSCEFVSHNLEWVGRQLTKDRIFLVNFLPSER